MILSYSPLILMDQLPYQFKFGKEKLSKMEKKKIYQDGK